MDTLELTERIPLVSVVMAAHNDARHISAAIESVLAQTIADLELVIVDDGSTDGTAAAVRRCDDPRIVLRCQPHCGVAAATNAAIRAARGRYVALCAADGRCRPNRLERQLAHLGETGLQLVFSWADVIDDAGRPVTDEHVATRWFNHAPRTRAERLAGFFFRGTDVCAVSCLAERQVFLDAGLFPTTSAQVSDLAMWLTLITRHDFGLLCERLIDYRVRRDGSAGTPASARRAYFELCQVYRDVFADCPIELFRAAFAGHLRRQDFSDGDEYALEQSFIYLRHDIPAVRALGLERLCRQLQDPSCLDVATRVYDIDLARLMQLTNSFDAATAVELLDARQWAADVHRAYTSLTRDRESLKAHSDALLADRQALHGAYEALQEELRKTQAEYQKLDTYTRHVLAVKDDILAELHRLQAASSSAAAT